jgi:hypothetical protein
MLGESTSIYLGLSHPERQSQFTGVTRAVLTLYGKSQITSIE